MALLIALPLTLTPTESSAADHYDAYDGDFITSDNERHHDIVDFFTFPSADKKRLVMIMNTYNRANASSMFDDKLAYTFRAMTGKTAGQGNEYRVTCRFSDGSATEGKQEVTCTAYSIVADAKSPTGRRAKSVLSVKAPVDVVLADRAQNESLKVFAGRRADAFFGDAAGLGEMLVTRKLPDAFKGPATNTGTRNLTSITDDMSVAVEVDFKAIFHEEATVFRVAVETAFPKGGR